MVLGCRGISVNRRHVRCLQSDPFGRTRESFRDVLLRTAKEAKSLCEAVGHPRIGVTIDTFHANIEERNIAEAVTRSVLISSIFMPAKTIADSLAKTCGFQSDPCGPQRRRLSRVPDDRRIWLFPTRRERTWDPLGRSIGVPRRDCLEWSTILEQYSESSRSCAQIGRPCKNNSPRLQMEALAFGVLLVASAAAMTQSSYCRLKMPGNWAPRFSKGLSRRTW